MHTVFRGLSSIAQGAGADRRAAAGAQPSRRSAALPL